MPGKSGMTRGPTVPGGQAGRAGETSVSCARAKQVIKPGL